MDHQEKPTDWSKLSQLFSDSISSQSQDLQLKAIITFAHLSKQAPESIIASAVPILINLLGTTPNPTVQEAVAYSLMLLTRRIDGPFAQIIGQLGAIPTILRLLPDSESGHRRCLLKCLSGIVAFDNSNRVILARNGGLQCVIDAIVSRDDDMRKYLLEILTALAMLREVRRVIVGYGGLPFLVEAVSYGKMISRTRAAQAIGLLGVSRRVKHMLMELGVVEALIGLLRDGDDSGRIIAGNALGVVSSHVNYLRPVAQAGAIPLYMELLRGNDVLGKEVAEDVFCVLAVAEENAVLILDHLVSILEGNEGQEAKAAAIDVIWNLSGYKHSISVVRESGAIPVLIRFLRDGNLDLREKASATIAQLSYEEENRGAMEEEGVIPILIELLQDGSEELREYAAESLINFAEDSRYSEGVSVAFEIPSFLPIRERLFRIRASDEDMTRSMRLLSVEQLITSDFDSV